MSIRAEYCSVNDPVEFNHAGVHSYRPLGKEQVLKLVFGSKQIVLTEGGMAWWSYTRRDDVDVSNVNGSLGFFHANHRKAHNLQIIHVRFRHCFDFPVGNIILQAEYLKEGPRYKLTLARMTGEKYVDLNVASHRSWRDALGLVFEEIKDEIPIGTVYEIIHPNGTQMHDFKKTLKELFLDDAEGKPGQLDDTHGPEASQVSSASSKRQATTDESAIPASQPRKRRAVKGPAF